jgi:hypothetical protein
MLPSTRNSMTLVAPSPSIRYPDRTIHRAERAVRCAPFRFSLYEAMVDQSVDLRSISGKAGVSNGYAKRVMTDLIAEVELLWLLEVGLLRREVDGQGLTDGFRVTPLGRRVIDRYTAQGRIDRTATMRDRLYNAISRWFRLPF